MYELLIKGATVVDGTGQPSFVADVGVSGGQIIDIAEKIAAKAAELVEAEGLVLSPGFIDAQNHSDSYWSLFDEPGMESMLLQGFTTIFTGHCGTSLAPLLSPEALKSSRKWHDLYGLNFNWTSFADFAAALATRQFGCNVGSLVGYSTLRRALVGDAPRLLTSEEAKILSKAVEDSLAAGAFGLSFGLSYAHETHVSEIELFEMAQLVSRYDRLFSLHLRSDGAALAEAVEEAVEVGARSKVRMKLAHFKIRGQHNWPLLPDAVARLENGVHRGADVAFDVYPYDTTWQPLYTYLPRWAIEGGRAQMLEYLSQAESVKKILAFLQDNGAKMSELIVASTSFNMRVNSKSLGQIASNFGSSSEQAALEVLRHGGAEVLVFDKALNDEQVEDLLMHPLSVVASDGGAFSAHPTGYHASKLVHPRCFGTTANFLARVRQTRRISLETAVSKLTSLPARLLGLKHLGQIAVGRQADLVLFDPLGLRDAASLQNPYLSPDGVSRVWVNGQLAAAQGRVTKVMAGKFLTAN